MKSPKQFIAHISKFRPKDLLKYVVSKTKRFGVQITYILLLMIHAYRRSDTPGWAKRIVIGSIAYVLAPIDAVPDLTPLLGLTDDLGVLSYGLVAIAGYVNQEVKNKSKKELLRIFGNLDKSVIEKVDAHF